MQTLQAAVMGGAQGLSEFLPISSSAHIVFTSTIYKILTGLNFAEVTQEEIFFDILIHLSTLFAVVIFFFKDLKEIFKGFFEGLKNKNYEDENFKTFVYVFVATCFTCVLAFLIKDLAHDLTENPAIVSILLIITAIILYSSEKFRRKTKNMDLKTAILTGIAQGLAVFPGLSRSGLTIATGIFSGVERVKAARFSFILSVPIIILASLIYPLLELDFAQIQTFNFKAIIIGCVTAFVSGYLCIKFFMKFLEKFSLKIFAYYCLFVGIIMFFVSIFAK